MRKGLKPIELEAHELVRARWPKWLRDQFEKEKPHSVWVGGTLTPASHTLHPEGKEPIRLGANRPFRALTVGSSGSYADTVTWRLDQIPYEWQGLLGRVWVEKESRAASLEAAAGDALRAIAEPVKLRKKYVAVHGMNEDLTSFLLRVAEENIIAAWDDHGLIVHLIRAYRQRRIKDTKTFGDRGRIG